MQAKKIRGSLYLAATIRACSGNIKKLHPITGTRTKTIVWSGIVLRH
jgi:hypothetical protein